MRRERKENREKRKRKERRDRARGKTEKERLIVSADVLSGCVCTFLFFF